MLWLTKDCILVFSGALDHITVTTNDGKFPLNQLGQISMKSPQLLVVNMTGFPEVQNQTTDGFLAEILGSYCCMQCQAHTPKNTLFPIDTPLVLRLVKTHMGKCLFSPELKSYLITQWNCTTIGSCRCRKQTNGSAAELHEPMATIRANIPAETGGASGYISGRFAIGSSDFFSFSDDDFVYADPEKPTRRWHASQ